MERLESFWDYREFFRLQMLRARRMHSAESAPTYGESLGATPLHERLIQAIWSNQLIQPDGLRLVDGRRLRVVDPGRWNGSAGPDFQAARLMIDTEMLTGDVEVHLKASSWRAHRHQTDLDYNRTILHVIYENDDSLATDMLHNGSSIPRLVLEPYLFPDLDTIRKSMTADDYLYDRPPGVGRCHEMMVGAETERVIEFLEHGGDERFLAKTRRLADQLQSAAGTPEQRMEQTFHQAIMMSLGSGSGKPLYYLLAKRAPLHELMDYAQELAPAERRLGLESLLLHVAGLMPTPEAWDDSKLEGQALQEARDYATRLAQLWQRFEPYWKDHQLAPTRRWYKGIRPVNFPGRRLAAMASLIERAMRLGKLPLDDLACRLRAWGPRLEEARPTRKMHPALRELVEWFELPGAGSFWENRFSFTAAPSSRPMALLGQSTAQSLVFNAVLPALALRAQQTADEALGAAVHKVYSVFPPLPSNHITDFMVQRLFGPKAEGSLLLSTERRQQGLFQIFHSCCNGEERNCESCYYEKQG